MYQGRRVGWHTGAAVPPVQKKKEEKRKFPFTSVFLLFFIELKDKFVSFSNFTFNFQIFVKWLALQAKTVCAAF